MSAELTAPAAAQAPSPAVAVPVWRQFAWSVRRELWEHRSLWIAPLAVGAVATLAALFSTAGLPATLRLAATPAGASEAAEAIAVPYAFTGFAIVLTGVVTSIAYCLGVLNAERRDRSILFWKSLPVSDLVTVLAKAAPPILIMPAVEFAAILAAHLLKMAVSAVVVLASGGDLGLWAHNLPAPRLWLMLLDGLPYMALWYAPLFAWLILVSAWARRVPFLWAFAPPLLAGLVERLAFGSHAVWSWLGLRLVGPFLGALPHHGALGRHGGPMEPPGWDSPHLWVGLVLAALFLAGAVRLRRRADPF